MDVNYVFPRKKVKKNYGLKKDEKNIMAIPEVQDVIKNAELAYREYEKDKKSVNAYYDFLHALENMTITIYYKCNNTLIFREIFSKYFDPIVVDIFTNCNSHTRVQGKYKRFRTQRTKLIICLICSLVINLFFVLKFCFKLF